MNPIYPWLDPIEVRRLAERLMMPAKASEISVKEAGFDEAFVGYASSPPPSGPATQATPAPVAAPAPEPTRGSAPVATHPEPVQQPVSETISTTARGPFLDRIQQFRDWMHHNFSASGVFLLDREGSVIFDESDHGRLHFLARSLAQASRRQGSSATNVHVKIGASATLEVIPVETPYGCLVLGAVVPDALPPAAVTAVMRALLQVSSPQA